MATSKSHHDSERQSIEKSGKVTTFYPRGLRIVWGEDKRYWELPEELADRNKPAELKNVSWLEVTATADLEAGKKHKLYFELSFTEHASGWNDCNVYLMTKLGPRGRYKKKLVSLKEKLNTAPTSFIAPEKLEIEVPASSSSSTEDTKLHFGLYEVWSGKWKKGLRIHKAVIEEISEEK